MSLVQMYGVTGQYEMYGVTGQYEMMTHTHMHQLYICSSICIYTTPSNVCESSILLLNVFTCHQKFRKPNILHNNHFDKGVSLRIIVHGILRGTCIYHETDIYKNEIVNHKTVSDY